MTAFIGNARIKTPVDFYELNFKNYTLVLFHHDMTETKIDLTKDKVIIKDDGNIFDVFDARNKKKGKYGL